MANASFREYQLYCPICDHTFTQLLVLHKLPKDLNVDSILANCVAGHDHKAYQDAKARKNQTQVDQKEKAE
jgi:hypothetical protein